MPGNVSLASPSTVMPYATAQALSEAREHVQRYAGPYRDGSAQVAVQTTLPRKTWAIAAPLTFDQLADLIAFYAARNGPQEPFYFYPLEADYDATGVSPTGRYTVRFDGPITRAYRIGRVSAEFRLVEVA